LTAPPVLFLGAQQTLLNYFAGDIAEVRIFDAALPAIARQGIESALRTEYLGALPPTLSVIAANKDSVTFSWPAVSGFNLYSTTNLTSPVAWSPVTNVPAISNGTNSVNLNADGPASFFKLVGQ
jgi:hypothetical protein